MKDTVRINFDFPREEYAYLKMMCTKQGKTIKDYANEALIERIEDDEDELWAKVAEKDLNDINQETFAWEDVKKELAIDV